MKKLALIPLLGFFLLSLPQLVSASALKLDIEGNCTKYNVTLVAQSFNPGCYDAKVDVTSPQGRVGFTYNPRKGWKSSFFYIDNYLCINKKETNKSKQLKIKVSTRGNVSFQGKLRKNSETWETKYYKINQNCPVQSPVHQPGIVILASLIVIWIILIGLVIYEKD